MLQLPVDVQKYALTRIEIGRTKLRPTPQEINPNMRFVENPILNLIDDSPNLHQALGNLSWGDHTQVIRSIYTQMAEAPFFQEYMEAPTVSFNDNRKIITGILSNFVEDNPLVEAQLEELSIFWLDDIGYALSVAVQTIDNIKPSDQDLNIPNAFKNEDDQQFATTLFDKTILHFDEYITLVDSITTNWDPERIALMDRVLMATAITEFVNCPTIPIKATLDEFIEISKYYSTPQSNVFINGILDKAANILTDKGEIKKIGRGLL